MMGQIAKDPREDPREKSKRVKMSLKEITGEKA